MRLIDLRRTKKISISLDTDFKIQLQQLIDGEIERKKGK